MGFAGDRCEIPQLSACMLGDHALPVRSWVLHAFHDNAGRDRWPGAGAHPIGPVPCECLLQFVSAPFFLERTRLQYMRGFVARCVRLPSSMTLEQFLARPPALADSARYWAAFSFEAAHDALRMGAHPSLYDAPLDPDLPQLGTLIHRFLRARKEGQPLRRHRLAGYHVDELRAQVAGCLLPSSATGRASAPRLPIIGLANCSDRCGRVGWCEARQPRSRLASDNPHLMGECGCFVPGGLSKRAVGGANCLERRPWRADLQPYPHWGPFCPLNCSGRGACDWQGFCRCDDGYWGMDCGISRGVTRRVGDVRTRLQHRDSVGGPRVDVDVIERPVGPSSVAPSSAPSSAASRVVMPEPLTPLEQLLRVAPDAGRRSLRGGGGGGRRRRASPLIYVLDMPPLLRFGVDFAAQVRACTAPPCAHAPLLPTSMHRPSLRACIPLPLLASVWTLRRRRSSCSPNPGPDPDSKPKPKQVELALTERLLRSSHRAPTADDADYLWMPGAPLVIDGHRLLARLWYAATRWLPAVAKLLVPPPGAARRAHDSPSGGGGARGGGERREASDGADTWAHSTRRALGGGARRRASQLEPPLVLIHPSRIRRGLFQTRPKP